MKFKKSSAGGINMLVAAATVLVPGILIWVLLGEFNVLGLDYLHALGAPSGSCYAEASTTTPVACAAGTQVLLHPASKLDWRVAVACCALIPWAIGSCACFCWWKWTGPRIYPYAVGTALLIVGVVFSGAIPHANDALLIFARVIIALVSAAFGFLVTNLITNAALLLNNKGKQVYEQVSKEIAQTKSSKEQDAKRKQQNRTANDKDYVEDIKR